MTFFRSGAFQWRREQRSGRWVNLITQTKDLPEDVEFSAWDAVQNLRASLDLAVCATAISASAENLKNTYFHFASSEAEWERSFKGRTRAAPPFAIETMRSLKPWEGGNNILYALARISAVERHQLVKPMLMQNNSIAIEGDASGNIRLDGGGDLRIGTRDWDINRRELVITESLSPIEIPIPGYRFTTFLAFGDVPLLAREPFIPRLNALCEVCAEIVDALDAASA